MKIVAVLGGRKEKEPSHKQVMAMCDRISDIDDTLGQFADYEGNEWGPTYSLWKAGKERLDQRCEYAVEAHLKAARLWRNAKTLNNRRPTQPAPERQE